MNKKQKFVAEYEMNASPKMLFSYLNSATGLSEWFAEDVKITPEKIYLIDWEGETHRARITSQRLNSYVKLEFLPKNGETDLDPSYIEFKIDTNEITQTTFLKIVDFTDLTEGDELIDLWDNLIDNLKEIVGG